MAKGIGGDCAGTRALGVWRCRRLGWCRSVHPSMALAALRPSEYTAALIQVLQAKAGLGARRHGAGDRLGQRRRAGGAGRAGRGFALRHRHRGGRRRVGHAAAGANSATARRRSSIIGDMWLPVGGPPLRPDRRQPAALPDGAQRRSRPPAELERRRRRRPRAARSFPRRTGAASGAGGRADHHPQRLRRPRPLARDRRAGLGLSLRHRADDAGLYSRRQARAHDASRACRAGRPHRSTATAPTPSAKCTSSRSQRPGRSADEAARFSLRSVVVAGACCFGIGAAARASSDEIPRRRAGASC